MLNDFNLSFNSYYRCKVVVRDAPDGMVNVTYIGAADDSKVKDDSQEGRDKFMLKGRKNIKDICDDTSYESSTFMSFGLKRYPKD
jgi:hypothetical protein